jgi:hypothetical protein
MLDIDFDDLQVNLTDSPIGCCIGTFEGSFSVDLNGSVDSITFAGYVGRKSNWHTVDVPDRTRPDSDLTFPERFIREIANNLEAAYDRTIKDEIDDWHMSNREGREYDGHREYAL